MKLRLPLAANLAVQRRRRVAGAVPTWIVELLPGYDAGEPDIAAGLEGGTSDRAVDQHGAAEVDVLGPEDDIAVAGGADRGRPDRIEIAVEGDIGGVDLQRAATGAHRRDVIIAGAPSVGLSALPSLTSRRVSRKKPRSSLRSTLPLLLTLPKATSVSKPALMIISAESTFAAGVAGSCWGKDGIDGFKRAALRLRGAALRQDGGA